MNEKSPLFLGFEGLEPDWKAFTTMNPLGVVLFQRNLESLEQIQGLCDKIHRDLPGSIIAVDQEGGRVNRLDHLLPPFSAPPVWHDEATSRLAGKTMAEMLNALGIDMNFAPAIDLDYGEEDNALQGRLLGNDVDTVVRLSDAYLHGLMSAGCMGCIKHFPGLGTTHCDSHFFLPEFGGTEDEWNREEAEVYRKLFSMGWNHVPVMVAHCVIPFWENQVASCSPVAMKHLRAMGSTGLVMTDDLEMKAVSEDELEGFARSSLQAGIDALMVCRSLEKAERLAGVCKEFTTPAMKRLELHQKEVIPKTTELARALDSWNAFAEKV
jgi:beta-N-acetylhexosaminidase